MKGTAVSFLGFLGNQMSESRGVRREERREQRAESREMNRAFMKIFMYMIIGVFAFGIIAFIVMQLRGDSSAEGPIESEPTAVTETVQENGTGTGGGLHFEFHTGTGN